MIEFEQIKLVGKNCILRPVLKSDYLAVYDNMQDKKIAFFVGTPYPYGQIEAKQFIENAIKNNKEKNELQLAIVSKENGQLMGMIGLKFESKDQPVAEIGFWIGSTFRGKGIMTEAVQRVLGVAFNELKLERVYGRAYSQNRSSCRVFEKNNFLLEGRLRKDSYGFGLIFDTNVYGILKKEYGK